MAARPTSGRLMFDTDAMQGKTETPRIDPFPSGPGERLPFVTTSVHPKRLAFFTTAVPSQPRAADTDASMDLVLFQVALTS